MPEIAQVALQRTNGDVKLAAAWLLGATGKLQELSRDRQRIREEIERLQREEMSIIEKQRNLREEKERKRRAKELVERLEEAPPPGPPAPLPALVDEVRGLHLDPSRRPLAAAKVVEIAVNAKAQGFNTLHLHLTDDQGIAAQLSDKAEVPREGELRAPWTFEEQRWLGLACEDLDIAIVPEIDIPGHAVALLSLLRMIRGEEGAKYETKSQYGIKTDELIDVDKDLPLIIEMFDGLADRLRLKPGGFVHMGGDEWGGISGPARQPDDTVEKPETGSWNYARHITNRVCEWAHGRGLNVIAWEEHFKRLWGYKEMDGQPNVTKDVGVMKIVEDGVVKVAPPKIKGVVRRPIWTFEQLTEKVYALPDNLFMQTWINTPTFQWQRHIMPLDRQIKSDGYYLDAMWKSPLDMFREKDSPELAGRVACTWGEWIGQENIDFVLYPMINLLGAKFDGSSTSDIEILRAYLDGDRPYISDNFDTEELDAIQDTWKMREWIGFGKPEPGVAPHPLSTPVAPSRQTPMTQPLLTIPTFSEFLVAYLLQFRDLLFNGTPIEASALAAAEAHLRDAAVDADIKLPGSWARKYGSANANAQDFAAWLLRQMAAEASTESAEDRGKNVKSLLGRLNRREILGVERAGDVKDAAARNDVVYRNGFYMVHRRLKNLAADVMAQKPAQQQQTLSSWRSDKRES